MSKHPTRLGRARLWLAQVVLKTGASQCWICQKKEKISLGGCWRSGSFFFWALGLGTLERRVQGDKRTSRLGEQTDEPSVF